jgi:serine/threonine protein kinase
MNFIIKRDLKPANILKKGNVLKIGDFGFSKIMEKSDQKMQTSVGTPLYMSLQILKGE